MLGGSLILLGAGIIVLTVLWYGVTVVRIIVEMSELDP